MENVSIRRLVAEDEAAIARIHADITQTSDPTDFKPVIEEQSQRGGDASFVAEYQGRVVGYMICYILSGGFGMKKSAWIAMMGVDPGCMGQGIGEKLARHIFEHSKGQGVANVYTSVRWDSPDLLSFFKSLDFEKSNFINLLKRL